MKKLRLRGEGDAVLPVARTARSVAAKDVSSFLPSRGSTIHHLIPSPEENCDDERESSCAKGAQEGKKVTRGGARTTARSRAAVCCRRCVRLLPPSSFEEREGGSATALLQLGRRRPEWVSRRGFCHRWSSVAVVVMAAAPLAAGSSIVAARTSLSWVEFRYLRVGIKAAVGPPELLAAHGSFVGAIRSRSCFASFGYVWLKTLRLGNVGLSSGDFVSHKCCGGCRVIPFISEVVAELIRGAEAVSYIEKNTRSRDFDCDFELRRKGL
ncbi:uncharacterized protein DS421_14g458760 [Arachis hypogaea]|nr:uncharacterized protein DS421_14g458760 [Arachis hypogaea]